MKLRMLISLGICLSSLAICQLMSMNAGVSARSKAFDLPLIFEENRGQVQSQAEYFVRGSDFLVMFSPREVLWTPAAEGSKQDHESCRKSDSPDAVRAGVIRLSYLGMSPDATLVAEEMLPAKTSYLLGSDPTKWQVAVPNYRAVRYRDIYPGIDLVFYGNGKSLEYDFVIAPGANLEEIRLRFGGTASLRLAGEGDLVVEFGEGEIRHRAPHIYQELEGERAEVSGRFEIREGGLVGFAVDSYDPAKKLTIDPVLVHSSYFGGSRGEVPGAVAVDSDGSVYVVGSTGSMDLPLKNPVQEEFAGGGATNGDIFVTKIDPTGTSVVYSTYIGGTTTDIGRGIAVDAAGQIVATGTTFSTDFPSTPGAFQEECSGQCPFVFQLSADGSELVYSTFVGRGDGLSIAADSGGQAVIVGRTTSNDFPIKNAFQAARPGKWDTFVTKLNDTGNGLVFSTFLGGSEDDNLAGWAEVATDSSGSIFVTGSTMSEDFPLQNSVQSQLGGGRDAFVAKFNAQGGLAFSTYLGGTDEDVGRGVSVDSQGNALVAGTTKSADFPVENAFQPAYGGGVGFGDAFVAKISPAGGSLVYSTFLGGTGADTASDIAVDALDRATIVGNGASGFPVRQPLREFEGIDNVVCKLSSDGSELVYSTPIGGGDQDIAVATRGTNVYVAGNIATATLPVFDAVQPRSNGSAEAFLVEISDAGSLYFAHLSNGSEAGIGAVSDLLLTNSSESSESTATIKFSQDDGSPLPLNVTVTEEGVTVEQDKVSELTVKVAPLGLTRISTDGVGAVVSGAAVVDYDNPLGGVIRFTLSPFGTAGVGESKLVRGFITPVRKTAIDTGVAIYNPEDKTVALRMTLRDRSGEQVQGGIHSRTLDAGGHLARFVGEFFGSADLEDFEGTLTVEVTTFNALIAATALELGSQPGEFTTLPVTPIP